jgi:hypothetical protein
MKFKNNTNMDVYVDLGTLRRVSPGEVIDLPGALKCEGLSPMYPEAPPKPKVVKKTPKKKPEKTIKNTNTSGTI